MKKKRNPDEFSWELLGDINVGRENLGPEMPVAVYRLFHYTLRDVLIKKYGKEECIEILRESGELAGREFAENVLDLSLDLNKFVAHLQEALKTFKIGVLRVEGFDADTGKMVLTVGEDVDCSGLPVVGEAVCNYDEGFIAGILSTYTHSQYSAIEVDCWAKGDRTCRFEATKQ